MNSRNEKEVTIIYLTVLLAAMAVAAVLMPTRDAQVAEIDAAAEFYRQCMAKDGERVIVVSDAGNWRCNERHQVMGFAQGGGK